MPMAAIKDLVLELENQAKELEQLESDYFYSKTKVNLVNNQFAELCPECGENMIVEHGKFGISSTCQECEIFIDQEGLITSLWKLKIY